MNNDFSSQSQPPVADVPTEITSEETLASESSLLKKLFPKLNFSFDFDIPKKNIIIPALAVVVVLLIGGGGTYVVGTSIFQPSSTPQSVSSFDENDVPTFDDEATISTPTPTPVPAAPTTAVFATPTPVGTSSATANWMPYNFSAVFLNFSYPPGWFVNVANTSGAPYLFVQNYPTSSTPSGTTGNYSVYIGRLPQVGITTIAQLTTQLALNAANNTYIGTVNMGTTTVISSNPITINGYLALERTISYSAFPSVQYYEVFILDGVSNAIRFAPQLDITGTMPYFNSLLTTVNFTN